MVGVITGITVFGTTARILVNSKPTLSRILVLRGELAGPGGFTPSQVRLALPICSIT